MFFFFFQAEDGIRDLVRSRGLGDVYKRQGYDRINKSVPVEDFEGKWSHWAFTKNTSTGEMSICLLYTSDAADERSSVDLGGRRIIKKKKEVNVGRS